jgi:hypothetical protein
LKQNIMGNEFTFGSMEVPPFLHETLNHTYTITINTRQTHRHKLKLQPSCWWGCDPPSYNWPWFMWPSWQFQLLEHWIVFTPPGAKEVKEGRVRWD